MRVTVIGHSCLRLETRAGTILVDPWLSGSCYWRSWWHYPPSQQPDEEMLAPDWVYLTHHHFDHFHFPSMRRLDRRARVLIPKFGVDFMAGEVESLGFAPPRELAHGRVVDLGDGVRVASYQYGVDDSVFVVAQDDVVVVDINDAKVRGRTLRRIRGEFGPPTLACKSHSFAQSYPVLYDAEDPDDLGLITDQTYIDDFRAVMGQLKPRYAIPFGSMVGFLHPEAWSVNEHLVSPQAVADGIAVAGGIPGTEVVTMAPGDTWSSDEGFDRGDVDWYSDREEHLDALRRANKDKLDAQAESEEGRTVEWDAFDAHLGAFARAVPRIVARRLAPQRFVFHVPSDPETPYWWVSLRDRAVGRAAEAPPDRSGITTITEAVLADAIRDRIVHMIHGSMRIHTEVVRGGVQSNLGFWGLMMMWELGYLPVRRVLWRPRMIMAAARRWREGLDQLRVVVSRDPVVRLAGGLGARRPKVAQGSVTAQACPASPGGQKSRGVGSVGVHVEEFEGVEDDGVVVDVGSEAADDQVER